MTREDILGRIGSILDELKNECRGLYVQPQINAIELELFEANANFLKDHIAILRKVVQKEEDTIQIQEKAPIQEIPKVTSTDELIANFSQTNEDEAYAKPSGFKQAEESVIASIKFEEPQEVVAPLIVEPIVREEPPLPIITSTESIKPEPEISSSTSSFNEVKQERELTLEEKLEREEAAWAELNKRFQTKVPSLNDKISSQNQNRTELNSVIQPTVSDLRKAVGLNDKFAFIKGLFNNSVEAFDKALAELNACNNFDEAKRLVDKQLATQYNWSQKPDLHEHFLSVVKKRFNE